MFADDNLDIPAGYVNTKSDMDRLQKKVTCDPLFRSPARLNKATNQLRPLIVLLEPVISAEPVLHR